jgi:hypothetical protein
VTRVYKWNQCIFRFLKACYFGGVESDEEVICEPSVTRSGFVEGPFCRGDLIFEDEFEFLDSSKWTHEITMSTGVRVALFYF